MLSIFLGLLINYVSHKFNIDCDPIVDKIDALLPQTQCAQCNYPGCYAYASAIGNDGESIDKCIPGGNEIVFKIANLLNYDELKYKNLYSSTNVLQKIVIIDENNCVGCSKCRLVCPVDAIVGSYNFMHTVLPSMCTGCGLCIPLCPTNCIKEKKILYDNLD
ncbi:MAG: RnfABCDGE type electron transport complex subunit B [Buchnera aphidicola (Meitanaphis flavogallis)]